MSDNIILAEFRQLRISLILNMSKNPCVCCWVSVPRFKTTSTSFLQENIRFGPLFSYDFLVHPFRGRIGKNY